MSKKSKNPERVSIIPVKMCIEEFIDIFSPCKAVHVGDVPATVCMSKDSFPFIMIGAVTPQDRGIVIAIPFEDMKKIVTAFTNGLEHENEKN